MKSIADSSSIYPSLTSGVVQDELAKFTRLIRTILGSESIATGLLRQILLEGERPTVDNLRDRLRYAIESGLIQVAGISTIRLARLQAALELGKILHVPQVEVGTIIDSPEVAASVVQAAIGWSTVEHLAVLALNRKYRLLCWKVLAVGSAQETIAHPCEIIKFLIHAGASDGIILHNHPSGSTEPSPDDLILTEILLQASTTLCLPILDHIVVSRGQHTSIRSQSTLWEQANAERKQDRARCQTVCYRTTSMAHDRGSSPKPSG